MSNPQEVEALEVERRAFDQALEESADVLDSIALDVLSDPEILKKLADPDFDEAW